MKRRDVLKSMAALGAAVRSPEALFSQERPGSTAVPAQAEQVEETALPLTLLDEVGEPAARFFTAEEMAAFRRLAEVMVPRTRTAGALEAGAPEFLDFYIAHSATDRQSVYREGLARLEAEARRHFHKRFAELAAGDIDKLLAPLREPWTPKPPADPLARFLQAAKEDLFRATVNSRAWALETEGRRRSTGSTYWYPVE